MRAVNKEVNAALVSCNREKKACTRLSFPFSQVRSNDDVYVERGMDEGHV